MSFGLFHYKDRNHDGVDDELVGRPDGKYGDIGDFYSICKHSLGVNRGFQKLLTKFDKNERRL